MYDYTSEVKVRCLLDSALRAPSKSAQCGSSAASDVSKGPALAVRATATIPPGKPEQTALNLLGPILINHRARLGLQVPQPENSMPAQFFVRPEA